MDDSLEVSLCHKSLSVTQNPISGLQDRVTKKLGRPVTTGDIVYTFSSVASMPNGKLGDKQGPPAGFIASVQACWAEN